MPACVEYVTGMKRIHITGEGQLVFLCTLFLYRLPSLVPLRLPRSFSGVKENYVTYIYQCKQTRQAAAQHPRSTQLSSVSSLFPASSSHTSHTQVAMVMLPEILHFRQISTEVSTF